jgi:hypothetical protein
MRRTAPGQDASAAINVGAADPSLVTGMDEQEELATAERGRRISSDAEA